MFTIPFTSVGVREMQEFQVYKGKGKDFMFTIPFTSVGVREMIEFQVYESIYFSGR